MVSSTDVRISPAREAGSPAARERRLAGRLGRVNGQVRSGRFDRGLLVAGGLLMPLGILLVAIGWLGASHTVLTFEQISYLISGGLIGIALVVTGGCLFFTYWQALLIRNVRDHNEALRAQHLRLARSMERIEELLGGGDHTPLIARSGVPDSYVATATGTMLHRGDCPVVLGRPNLRTVSEATPGFRPCAICRPLATREPAPAETGDVRGR